MISAPYTRLALSLSLSLFALGGCAAKNADSPAEAVNAIREITLPPPTAAEGASLGKGGKDQPFQVGFGRSLPADQQRIDLSDLSWSAAPTGGHRAVVSVRSPEAQSVRVGIRLAVAVAGLKLTFAGAEGPITVVDSKVIAQQSSGGDPYWSPVIKGDTVSIELSTPTIPAPGVVLELPSVSHIR
ncbi:MAG: hypothetical protein ACREV5_19525 [Steroidobacter sp.]